MMQKLLSPGAAVEAKSAALEILTIARRWLCIGS